MGIFLTQNFEELDHVDDLTLFERYRISGERDALGELFNRYSHLTYLFCFKFFKEHEASEDAVIEIFMLIEAQSKSATITDFKAWYYAVARNFCLMQIREGGKKGLKVMDIEIEPENYVDTREKHILDQIIDEETTELIDEALRSLPIFQRLCLVLAYFARFKYEQIQEVTGFTMSTVKSHIQNGKRNLQKFIEERRKSITDEKNRKK